MRTVEVSRFVRAPPAAVERALDPEAVVGYEGTFAVSGSESTDRGTLVTATAPGMEAAFRFERREGGLAYEQVRGPFAELRTEFALEPENEGTRATATSAVSLGRPPRWLFDRVAAWKRRGELRRALAALADDLE